jgi:AcrR family transcriptional regulator
MNTVTGRSREQGPPGPGRSLPLLWGVQSRPGRARAGRPGLSVAVIVAAAIELADAHGRLDAVGMRQVAEHLGVGTMSLYTHVPGKAELTDLMIDSVYGELYEDEGEPARQPGGWRAAMEFIARRNWDLHQRHPWLQSATGGRPALGPNAVRKYEAELRPLDGIGLSDVEIDSVLTLVLTHVEGTAMMRARMTQAEQASGMNDTEWWATVGPALERAMNGAQFPVASRVGQASSEQYQGVADPAHALTFGLARILDGVAVLIAGGTSGVDAGR